MVTQIKTKVKELHFAAPSAIIHFTIILYNNAFHIQKGKQMTYQQFTGLICHELNLFLTDDITANIHSSLKNNGVTRIGVTISNPEINISPTIYLEDFYNQYQHGISLLDIIKRIIDIYDDVRFEQSWDTCNLQLFDSIKERLAYKLIHKNDNAQLLQGVPYITYHDLAIVFYLLMELSPSGSGTILITNDMARVWNVTAEELYQEASRSTPKLLPEDFRPMRSVVYEMLGTNCTAEDLNDNHMYILTNSIRQLGASAILYPDLLERISNELRDDFYILPSSIHEVIILPRRYSPAPEELDQMIVEINETQVAVDEILSDHAYYYSRLHKGLFLTH